MFNQLSKINQRNYILILLAAGFHFCAMSFQWFLPKFVKHIGGHEGHFGLVLGFPTLAILIMAPLAGFLSDHFAKKKLVIFGSFILIVSTGLFLFIKELSASIYFLRFLQGLGHAFVFSTLMALVAKIVPDKNKARGIAYFAVGIQLANSLGSFIAEYTILNISFNHFFIFSILIIVLSLSMTSFLKLEKEEKVKQVKKLSYAKLVIQKKFISGFILIFLIGGVFGTVLQFMATYFDFLFETKITSSHMPAAYFLTSALIIIAVSRAFFGGLIDKIKPKKIILVNSLFLILSIVLINIINSKILAFFISILFGMSYGFLYPVLNALVLNRATITERGKISGILVMLYDVGFIGFALFMGPIAKTWNYFGMFIILAFLFILGFFSFFILEKNIKLKENFKASPVDL